MGIDHTNSLSYLCKLTSWCNVFVMSVTLETQENIFFKYTSSNTHINNGDHFPVLVDLKLRTNFHYKSAPGIIYENCILIRPII